MTPYWYILACIFIPAIWGLIISAVYDAIDTRRKSRGEQDDAPIYTDFEI